MRIFNSATEAAGEVQRDLWEMGHRVVTKSMQDKIGEFATFEMVGYSFCLTKLEENIYPALDVLRITDPDAVKNYIEEEWKYRMGLTPWDSDPTRLRPDVWDPFREDDGKFSYTYRNRLVEADNNDHDWPEYSQMGQLTELHTNDRFSRQLVMTLYDKHQDGENRGGVRRVPCTMHYQILDRGNEFYLIDNMRSCDLYTHFVVDMIVAYKMAEFLVSQMGDTKVCPKLIMTFGSLHAYETDLKKRQIF